MEHFLVTLAILFISFFLGAIPWGVVISKVCYKDDVRKHGSGNIGSTNIGRTFGKKAAIIVFLLDFAKGLLAAFFALLLYIFLQNRGCSSSFALMGFTCMWNDTLLSASFFACILGHIFSPFLYFRGGKGIAVAVGNEFITITPVGALIELFVFGLCVAITRYISFGSLAAAIVCFPISIYLFWGNPVAILFMCTAASCVIWAHRSNIRRLLNGSESRISSKKHTADEEAQK